MLYIILFMLVCQLLFSYSAFSYNCLGLASVFKSNGSCLFYGRVNTAYWVASPLL